MTLADGEHELKMDSIEDWHGVVAGTLLIESVSVDSVDYSVEVLEILECPFLWVRMKALSPVQ